MRKLDTEEYVLAGHAIIELINGNDTALTLAIASVTQSIRNGEHKHDTIMQIVNEETDTLLELVNKDIADIWRGAWMFPIEYISNYLYNHALQTLEIESMIQ